MKSFKHFGHPFSFLIFQIPSQEHVLSEGTGAPSLHALCHCALADCPGLHFLFNHRKFTFIDDVVFVAHFHPPLAQQLLSLRGIKFNRCAEEACVSEGISETLLVVDIPRRAIPGCSIFGAYERSSYALETGSEFTKP